MQPRREHGQHLVQQRAAPLALLRRSDALGSGLGCAGARTGCMQWLLCSWERPTRGTCGLGTSCPLLGM